MEKDVYLFSMFAVIYLLSIIGNAPYDEYITEYNIDKSIPNNITIQGYIGDDTDQIGQKNVSTTPKFNITLWKYSADCSYNSFFGSCEPGKYIMPDNDAIKYVASNMMMDEEGRLEWENCIFEFCGAFSGYYMSDEEQFGYIPNGDYWINPDYYFYNGMKGDCEDVAFAVASVLEVKDIKTKIVGGLVYINGIQTRDWIVEYKINGTYYRYYGGLIVNDGGGMAVRFRERDDMQGIDFSPSIMFGRGTYYENYHKDW